MRGGGLCLVLHPFHSLTHLVYLCPVQLSGIPGLPSAIPKALQLIFSASSSASTTCPTMAPPLSVVQQDFFVTGGTFGIRATLCGSAGSLSFMGSAVMSALGLHFPTTFSRCASCDDDCCFEV